MRRLAIPLGLTLLACLCLLVAPFASANDPDADLARGIEAFNRGDLIGAMSAFEAAAEAGSADAQVRLAYILDQAEENEAAVRWYRAAADQGNRDGLAGLAEMYSKGEGVELDEARALSLFEQAALAGHAGAIRVLAAAYSKGHLGVTPDETRAEYWRSRQPVSKVATKPGE